MGSPQLEHWKNVAWSNEADLCFDIQMVGSKFRLNNMKAWIHPAAHPGKLRPAQVDKIQILMFFNQDAQLSYHNVYRPAALPPPSLSQDYANIKAN